MTEQVAESQESQVAEKPVFPDEMAKMSFEMLSKLIAERNSKVGTINAVKGDRQTLTEQVEAESSNPEIVEARKVAEAAKAQWDEAVMALHAVVTPEVDRLLADSESSVKEQEDSVKELDAKIKPGTNYFKKMYGENLAKHLPTLARLKGFSTKGAGSTGRRVRGFEVDVTLDDGTTKGFENFAQTAKYLEVETAALQEAFFKAAGKDNLKEIADRVDFSVNYTETYDDDSTEVKTANLVATRVVKDGDTTDESDEDESED